MMIPHNRRPLRRLVRRAAVATALVVAMLATACSNGGSGSSGDDVETFKLRYASIVPAALSSGQTLEWWAEEVKKRTDGRVEVEVYPAESLVKAFDVMPAVRDGRAHLGMTSSQYYPAEFPAWAVAGVPFVSTNAEATTRAFTKLNEENELIRSQFEKQGVKALFFIPLGSATFGSRNTITTPDDLRGQRLRSVGLIAEALKAKGAEPVALQPSEMYDSIERGVIDGWAGFGLDSLPGFGLAKVAPNIVDLGIGQFASTATIISLETWNEFPDDIKAILEQLSKDVTDHSMTVIAEAEAAACQTIKDGGATVTAFSAADIAEWKAEVSEPIRNQFIASLAGQGVSEADARALLDDYIAAVAEFEASATYKDGLGACAGTS